MQIKEAADQVGIGKESLRRLEKEGVLPPAPRNIVGRRIYSAEDILRIERIIRDRHSARKGRK